MSGQAMYQKRYQLRKLRGETAYVDTTAARTHIATLQGLGWSLRSIAGQSGVAVGTVHRIATKRQHQARPAAVMAIVSVHPSSLPSKPSTQTSEPFVPRVGTVRRIQALLFMGWSHAELKRRGVDSANLLHQQGRWVTRSTHDTVSAVFARLWMTPGPSTRTASRAKARGYSGPLDWDDIDHDTEPRHAGTDAAYLDHAAIQRRADGDRTVTLTAAEATELVESWLRDGGTVNDCERVTGLNVARVRRGAA